MILLHQGAHGPHHETWLTSAWIPLLHAAGMIIAYAFFFNIGTFIARYAKLSHMKAHLVAEHFWAVFGHWFRPHVTSQILGLLISFVALAIVVVHVFFDNMGSFSGHLTGIHQIVGFVVLVLTSSLPLLGVKAHYHYLKHGESSYYHTTHQWVGRLVLLGGFVSMGLGLYQVHRTMFVVSPLVMGALSVLILITLGGICAAEWRRLIGVDNIVVIKSEYGEYVPGQPSAIEMEQLDHDLEATTDKSAGEYALDVPNDALEEETSIATERSRELSPKGRKSNQLAAAIYCGCVLVASLFLLGGLLANWSIASASHAVDADDE